MDEWKIKGKPALVLLHMQEGIVGSLADDEAAQGVRGSDHLPYQQALLKAFRDKNLPVIYVVVDLSKNPDGSITAVDHKALEVIPELAPQKGEPVLTNWIFGAFTNSGLEQELRSRCVETVVFVGAALHVAVLNATVQAVDLWYSVVVAEDACVPTISANKTPKMVKTREVVLDLLSRYALVTTTEDIIAHIGKKS